MKLNNKELWHIYFALIQKAGYCRAINADSKIYEKLANKIEKELLK